MLTLLKPRPSRAYRAGQGVDGFGRLLSGLGRCVVRFSKSIILLSLTVVAAGGVGASRIRLDANLIRTFDREGPLYIADKVLYRLFDGMCQQCN